MSYRSNFLKSKAFIRRARTTVARRKTPDPCPRPVNPSSDQEPSSAFGSVTSRSAESSSESRDPVASFRDDDDLLRPSNASRVVDDRLPLDFIVISEEEAEGDRGVTCCRCSYQSPPPPSALKAELLSNFSHSNQTTKTTTGKSFGRGKTGPKVDRNPGRGETAVDNRPKINVISSNGVKPSKHSAQGADAMATHRSHATPPPPSGVNQATSGRIVLSVTQTLSGCSSLSRIPVLERFQGQKVVETARSVSSSGNESPARRTETRTNTPDGSVSGRTVLLTRQINSAAAKHASRGTAAPQKGRGTTAPSGVRANRVAVSALVGPTRKASHTTSKVSTRSSGGSSGVTVKNMDSSKSVQTQTSDTSQTTTLKNETGIPVDEDRKRRSCVSRSESVRRRDTLTANRTTQTVTVTRPLREKTSPEAAAAASIDHVTKTSARRRVSRIPVLSNGFRRSIQVQQPSHVKCQDATSAAGHHHHQQQQQQRPPVPPLRLPQAPSNTSVLSGSFESPSSAQRSPIAPPKQPPLCMAAAADWSPLQSLSLTQRTELLQPWILSLARGFSPSSFSDELSLTGEETDVQSNASEVSRPRYLSSVAEEEHRLLLRCNGDRPRPQTTKTTTRDPSRPYSAIPDLPSAVALLTKPKAAVAGGRGTKGSLSGVGRSESFNVRLRNRSNCTCPDSRVQGLSSPDVSSSTGKTAAGAEQAKRRFRPAASFDFPSSSVSDAFAPSPQTETVPRPATEERCCHPAVADGPAKPVAASRHLSPLDTCPAHFSVYNIFSIVNVTSDEERLEEILPAAPTTTAAAAEETTEYLGVCSVNEKLVFVAPSGDRCAPEKDRTSAMEQRAAEASSDCGRPLIIEATAVGDDGHLAFMSSARDDGAFGGRVKSVLEDESQSSGTEAKHRDEDEATARDDVTCHSPANTGAASCIRKPPMDDGITQCNELVVKRAEVRFCGETKNSATKLPVAGEVITVTEYKDSVTGVNLMHRSIGEHDLLSAEVKNSTKKKTLIPVMKVVSVLPTVVISTSAATKTETNKQKKRTPVNHPPTRKKEEEEGQTYSVVDVTFTDLDSSAFAIQQIADSDVRRDRKSSKKTPRSGTSGRKCQKVPSVDSAVERRRQGSSTLQTLLQLLQAEMPNEPKSSSSSSGGGGSGSSDPASKRHSKRRLQLPVVSSRHDDRANRTDNRVEAFDTKPPPTADGGGGGGVGPFPLGSSVTQIFTKRRRGRRRRRETATASKSEWSTALFAKTLYFEDEAKHKRTGNKTTLIDDVIDGRRSEGRLTTTTAAAASRFRSAAEVKQNRRGGGGGG